MNKIALAIHGGAGTIPKEDMPPTREKAYRQGLEDALKAGHAVLSAGGAALDAVEAAIREKFKGAVAQGNVDAAREAFDIVMEQEKKAEAQHA